MPCLLLGFCLCFVLVLVLIGAFVVAATLNIDIYIGHRDQPNPNHTKTTHQITEILLLSSKMSSSQILQNLISIPARSRQHIGNWRNRVSSGGMYHPTLHPHPSTQDKINKKLTAKNKKQRKLSVRVKSFVALFTFTDRFGLRAALRCIPLPEQFI